MHKPDNNSINTMKSSWHPLTAADIADPAALTSLDATRPTENAHSIPNLIAQLTGDAKGDVFEAIRLSTKLPDIPPYRYDSEVARDMQVCRSKAINDLRHRIDTLLTKNIDKFTCTGATVFNECLDHSAQSATSFSGDNAAQAFNILATISYTLITRPDDSSFHEISISAPAFQHINSVLIGYERILGLMGYRTVDESIVHMKHPAPVSKLLDIYQDLIVASMEMSLWQNIFYQISETDEPASMVLTWGDIAEERRKNVGDSSVAIARLIEKLKSNTEEVSFDLLNDRDEMLVQF